MHEYIFRLPSHNMSADPMSGHHHFDRVCTVIILYSLHTQQNKKRFRELHEVGSHFEVVMGAVPSEGSLLYGIRSTLAIKPVCFTTLTLPHRHCSTCAVLGDVRHGLPRPCGGAVSFVSRTVDRKRDPATLCAGRHISEWTLGFSARYLWRSPAVSEGWKPCVPW